MHILITGAAGMIGRKLVGAPGRRRRAQRPADRQAHADRRRRSAAAGKIFRQSRDRRRRYRRSGDRARGRRRPARRDLSSRRRGFRRGRARFREGHAGQSRRLARAVRSDPHRRRRLSPAARLHLVDRGVRRAVPGGDRRRLSSNAADVLRHAEGGGRASARRLHPPRLSRRRRHPAAEHRGAAGPAEQGGVGLFFLDHPRTA